MSSWHFELWFFEEKKIIRPWKRSCILCLPNTAHLQLQASNKVYIIPQYVPCTILLCWMCFEIFSVQNAVFLSMEDPGLVWKAMLCSFQKHRMYSENTSLWNLQFEEGLWCTSFLLEYSWTFHRIAVHISLSCITCAVSFLPFIL